MDMTTIMTAIQGIGFPIVAFFMVYKTSNEQNEKWTNEISNITKSIIELTESVKNQSEILLNLVNTVKGGDK